jgi:hypothetical protein
MKTHLRQGALADQSDARPRKTKKQLEVAALRGTPQLKNRQNMYNEAVPTMNKHEVSRNKQRETGQSIRAPTVNSISVKNCVFWDITPCGSCKNRRFGGAYGFLHQDGKNQ